MRVEIKVPSLGESILEAVVAKWLKKLGEQVTLGESLVELETDKVTVEVPSPGTGKLTDILVPDGQTVSVGTTIARIETGDDESGKREQKDRKDLVADFHVNPSDSEYLRQLSPSIRRIVLEKGISPAGIPATGRDGRITKEDILNFQEVNNSCLKEDQSLSREGKSAKDKKETEVTFTPSSELGNQKERRVRMTYLRQRIAIRLKEAQNTAATLTTFNEIDMSQVMSWRERYNESFRQSHQVKLSFMSFFAKACVAALRHFPVINAILEEESIIYRYYYHIGIAVSTTQGLVVPVVKDVDLKSFVTIEKEISELAKKARDGKLVLTDLSGGTFTITNGGVYGSLMSTPIINPPQSAILGMHKIQPRPVVTSENTIQARPMMYVALSYDHRIIDGREAVLFLTMIKEHIEEPETLLLEL